MKDKSNLPLVSVLIPAYNAEKYVEESINSILNQTYSNFEIIVVDDFSKDNTVEKIKNLTQKDSRIKLYLNKENEGISKTRNKLIDLAKGEYIMWQDADDISIETRMEDQVNFLEKNKDVGIVGGNLLVMDEKARKKFVRKYNTDDKNIRKNIFKYTTLAQPVAMVRKKILEVAGYFDNNYPPAEDLDMLFRIGSITKFGNINKVLLNYREYNLNSTFKKLRIIELNTISIRLRYSNNQNFKMTTVNHLYNILHYVSVFIIPKRIKILIFNLFRNLN